MRYSSTIDNVTSLKWGLTLQEAYLYSWVYTLPSWAESINISGKIYYFASKNKAAEEIRLLSDKPDTIYRYYKRLEKLKLIELIKVSNKDYICLTNVSKEWNNKSEYSKDNPTLFGRSSESNSDKRPTNNNYNIDNKISNKRSSKEPSLYKKAIDVYNTFVKEQTGVGAKIDGAEGKAMKSILSFLKKESNDKSEDGIIITLEYIFSNWSKLEPFYKNSLRLTQINSNFINIINQLKNGKKQGSGKQASDTERLHESFSNDTNYNSL